MFGIFFKLTLIFVAYYTTARIGLSFDPVGEFAALVWPPSGIALASLLIFGIGYWPGIFIAALLVNYHEGAPLQVASLIAVGNTFSALISAYILKNVIGFKNSLNRVKDVVALVFIAAVVCTVFAASVGTSSLLLGGLIQPAAYDEVWLAWWIGDMLGVVVVAPLILVWSRKPSSLTPKRLGGAILLALLLTFISIIVFGGYIWKTVTEFPVSYVVYPVLIWIALKYRQRGNVTAVFVMMIIAVWLTFNGRGPFASSDLSESLLYLQIFIGITAATFMIMAATVSQYRKLAAQLSESETRFRDIADTAPDIIWVTNDNGDFTYLSKEWNSFTGLKKRVLPKSDWLMRVTPKKRKFTNAAITNAYSKKVPFNIRYGLKNRKGKYKWVMHSGVPKFDIEGNFEGFIGTITDIEDALRGKKSEERARQLAQQRAELLALNKAKDEFIAIASHQLRTPATGVKQYIGMLLEGFSGKMTKEQTYYLQRAYENNERQLKIINDLLGIAQIDSDSEKLNLQKVNITSLLNEIIQSESHVLNSKNQTLKYKKGLKEIFAYADKDKLKMAIENIIDNASKYSHGGTEIIINLTSSKNLINIAISDQGVGIHKKDFDKLFRKFSRLDNPLSVPVGGTGLGLYWVKKIVDLHGGEIKVISKPNNGSTFILTIPRNTF